MAFFRRIHHVIIHFVTLSEPALDPRRHDQIATSMIQRGRDLMLNLIILLQIERCQIH